MTPKEKAKELVNRYMNLNKVKLSDYSVIYTPTAKQCALIAVDEILNVLWHTHKNETEYRYYQEVKQEILKL
jgi:hypothetical protein